MVKSQGIQLGRSTAKGARNATTQRLKGKRKAVDAFDDLPLDSFLLAGEDDAPGGGKGGVEDAAAEEEAAAQEDTETAEQKRLRIGVCVCGGVYRGVAKQWCVLQ